MIRLSIVGYVILVGVIATLVFRHSLFASHPIGIAVQLASFLLMIWARITLGWRSFHPGANPTEGKLVTNGPYAFVRHPIYAAILYFFWTSAITHPSILNFLLVLLATGAAWLRIVTEERFLFSVYPEYAAYAARTKRVIPYLL